MSMPSECIDGGGMLDSGVDGGTRKLERGGLRGMECGRGDFGCCCGGLGMGRR